MNGQLIDWLTGNLTPEARIWSALAPGNICRARSIR